MRKSDLYDQVFTISIIITVAHSTFKSGFIHQNSDTGGGIEREWGWKRGEERVVLTQGYFWHCKKLL
jgi:hypothetical protein